MHSVRAFVARFALFALLGALVLTVIAPAASAAGQTEYDKVFATAKAQLGDKWEYRARGPNRFDCSGLMFYSFDQNGLKLKIGGYRSVGGYYRWFKEQGKVSRDNPQLGDLIVWGDNQHIGMYIGDGMAISTLTTRHGVSIHPVHGYLGVKFKAYLHVDITRPH
jgi:cell wall-associated NlpC family hydrolase